MSMEALEEVHFKTTLSRELLHLVLGEMIGEGCFRMVYQWKADPTLVAKVEPNGGGHFCNATEYYIWQRVKLTEHAKWFAPVLQSSGCGLVILQKRTKPVKAKDLPKEVPHYFTDLKASNWGRYQGRVVCHDFAAHRMTEQGMSNRMRRADWDQ